LRFRVGLGLAVPRRVLFLFFLRGAGGILGPFRLGLHRGFFLLGRGGRFAFILPLATGRRHARQCLVDKVFLVGQLLEPLGYFAGFLFVGLGATQLLLLHPVKLPKLRELLSVGVFLNRDLQPVASFDQVF